MNIGRIKAKWGFKDALKDMKNELFNESKTDI